MADGWVRLKRMIADTELWTMEKPFTLGQAWVDLLMHTEFRTHKGKDGRRYRAGCVYMSELQLAERWGWTRWKTDRMLGKMERDGYIKVQKTPGKHGGCEIYVVGWSGGDDRAINRALKLSVNAGKSGNDRAINRAYYNTGSLQGKPVVEDTDELPSGPPLGSPPDGGASRPEEGSNETTLADALREIWEVFG